MEQKNEGFAPIKLPKTNVISRKGYYTSEITDAEYKDRNGSQALKVDFKVVRGKYKGFRLDTMFYDSFKSRLRLSYLCAAVGISEELRSPSQIIGKRLKLRVVPSRRNYMGRGYIDHRITRFHPLDADL
jgi:hypothetical protein